MQRVLKILSIGVLVSYYTICYASFEVDPLNININAGQRVAILNIVNQDMVRSFALELRSARGNKASSDLDFSPSSFTLLPNQRQLIRIITKNGINYAGKGYILHIKTDPSGLTPGKATKFKIPIHIHGLVTPNTTEQLDRNASMVSPTGDQGGPSNAQGLSQIRITIPVSATVGGEEP